jgi:hypothetical protein
MAATRTTQLTTIRLAGIWMFIAIELKPSRASAKSPAAHAST